MKTFIALCFFLVFGIAVEAATYANYWTTNQNPQATTATNVLNSAYPTNGVQTYWSTPMQFELYGTNFLTGAFNGRYRNQFMPYIFFDGSTAQLVFNMTNEFNSHLHITNDWNDGTTGFLIESNQSAQDSSFDAYILNGSGLNQLNYPSNAVTQVSSGNAIAAVLIPNAFASNLVTVPYSPNDRAISIATNGNNWTATLGGVPYTNAVYALLFSSFQPFDIILPAGQCTPQEDISAPFTLAPMQSLSGVAMGTPTIINEAIYTSISNVIQNINTYGGAQLNPIGTLTGESGFSYLTMRNCNWYEPGGTGSGDVLAANSATNCIFDNVQLTGWENVFQGAPYGTNVIRNCYIKGISWTNDPSEWSFPFFCNAGNVTNGWQTNYYKFEGDDTIELDDSGNPHSAPSANDACLIWNATNTIFDFRGASVHFVHKGVKNNPIAIVDNTGTATFLGPFTDNGTNMIGNGTPGGGWSFASSISTAGSSSGQVLTSMGSGGAPSYSAIAASTASYAVTNYPAANLSVTNGPTRGIWELQLLLTDAASGQPIFRLYRQGISTNVIAALTANISTGIATNVWDFPINPNSTNGILDISAGSGASVTILKSQILN